MSNLDFGQVLAAFAVLLFALTVHESAHAWVADRLGDPTARRLGRVSLNPVVHVDVVGTIVFPLVAMFTGLPVIGWAKPVPVNPYNLRDFRRDHLFIALAGPASNFLLALISAFVARAVLAQPAVGWTGAAIVVPLSMVAMLSLDINMLLALFNLVPVPPLDGSSVLSGLLPERLAGAIDSLRPYGFVLLYALMLSGALSAVIVPPYRLLLSWLH
ncbi:MAG: site-2 protease family protein [Vicinamibacterales bacterium]